METAFVSKNLLLLRFPYYKTIRPGKNSSGTVLREYIVTVVREARGLEYGAG